MIKKLGQRLKNEKGLTLIELLAVIVILGIIAAIAIPSIGGIIQKSKEDAAKADAIQVLNGAKLYVAANGLDKKDLVKADLDSYVDSVKLASYAVTVKNTGTATTYHLTGKTSDLNGVIITFTDATVSDINKDKAKGTREIKPTP